MGLLQNFTKFIITKDSNLSFTSNEVLKTRIHTKHYDYKQMNLINYQHTKYILESSKYFIRKTKLSHYSNN